MAGLSTYLANAVLNWLKSTAMPSDPANTYIALFDGDPTDAGSGGTEVTATIDATGRKAVTWGSIASKKMSNSADVDFGTADGGADITHIGLFDASTSGNMLASFELATPRTVTAGDPVKFATGDLVFDLTTC